MAPMAEFDDQTGMIFFDGDAETEFSKDGKSVVLEVDNEEAADKLRDHIGANLVVIKGNPTGNVNGQHKEFNFAGNSPILVDITVKKG